MKFLSPSPVKTILDVGANIGQFGIDMRRHGFIGEIVSFEPVSEIYLILTRTAKNKQPWRTFQVGLGSSECEKEIFISHNDGLSSSLLAMENVHLNNFPSSVTTSSEVIKVTTIDKQLDILGIDPEKIMLKLDVQGYEGEVLKGASKSLSKIPFCFLEVSLVSLYEGEILFLPILNMLKESGHTVVDVFRGVTSKNGQLLQLDTLTKLTVK